MSCKSQKKLFSIAIWKDVFGDDDSFIELYFRKVYRDDYTRLLVDYSTSDPIAQVQILPYHLFYKGERYPIGYISGAATSLTYRGKGIMTQLMRNALTYGYQRGDICSFLIPADEGLYEYYRNKAHYASVTSRMTYLTPHTNQEKTLDELVDRTLGTDAYKQFIRARKQWEQPSIAHTYTQWRTIHEEAQLSSGGRTKLGIWRKMGAEHPNQLLLTEKCSNKTEADFDDLPTELKIIAPQLPFGTKEKHGMLRLVNVPQMLQIHAKLHPKKEWNFDLLDPQLVPNTGRYRVSEGKLLFQPLSAQKLRSDALSPSTLAEQLFASTPIYIDLMLD